MAALIGFAASHIALCSDRRFFRYPRSAMHDSAVETATCAPATAPAIPGVFTVAAVELALARLRQTALACSNSGVSSGKSAARLQSTRPHVIGSGSFSGEVTHPARLVASRTARVWIFIRDTLFGDGRRPLYIEFDAKVAAPAPASVPASDDECFAPGRASR